MSVMNMITNTGIIIGLPIALIGTVLVLHNLIKKRNILFPIVLAVVGVLSSIPFLLCEYYGEEYVESEKTFIYSYDNEYLLENPDGTYYVYVSEEDNFYTQRIVNPSTINNIKEDEEPYLQIVTTYWRFGIFETSKQVHILWLPIE